MKEEKFKKNRISEIRQQFNISRHKNIAIAKFKIGNIIGELIAISGQNNPPRTVNLPQSPIFTTFDVPQGHSRAYDSEYKILEHVAAQYQDTRIEGTIDLLTERPPCDSCSYVITQFRQRFPNITLNVSYLQ